MYRICLLNQLLSGNNQHEETKRKKHYAFEDTTY